MILSDDQSIDCVECFVKRSCFLKFRGPARIVAVPRGSVGDSLQARTSRHTE
jgi:hypothetical protein